MTAIQLSSWNQIKGGDQQTRPASPGDWVETDIQASGGEGCSCEEISDPVEEGIQGRVIEWLGKQLPFDDKLQE